MRETDGCDDDVWDAVGEVELGDGFCEGSEGVDFGL